MQLKCGCRLIVSGKPDEEFSIENDDQVKQIQFCDKHLKGAIAVIQDNGGIERNMVQADGGPVEAGEITMRALSALEDFIKKILVENLSVPEFLKSGAEMN